MRQRGGWIAAVVAGTAALIPGRAVPYRRDLWTRSSLKNPLNFLSCAADFYGFSYGATWCLLPAAEIKAFSYHGLIAETRSVYRSRRRCDSSVKKKSASEDYASATSLLGSVSARHQATSDSGLIASAATRTGYVVLPEGWAEYTRPRSPATRRRLAENINGVASRMTPSRRGRGQP